MEDARSKKRKVLIFLLLAQFLVAVGVPAQALPAADQPGLEERGNEFTELYQVEQAGTVGFLARAKGLDPVLVAAMNFLEPGDPVEAGKYLVLPRDENNKSYVVKRGDTLWGVARVFGVDLARLIERNRIANPDLLRVGEVLEIPDRPGQEQQPPFPGRRQNRLALASRSLPQFRLAWPLQGEITSGYGIRGREFHHGLDIAGDPGEPIRAAFPGRVIFSGWKSGIYGRTVVLDHGNGRKTLYSHNSLNQVEEGEEVAAGQVIALVGSTGRTTGPHLHFEVYEGERTVNPLGFLP